MANSGELTNAELAILNNILYTSDVTNSANKDKKLGQYVKQLRKQGIKNLCGQEGTFDLTEKEWDQVLTAVEKNEKLSSLTMEEPYLDKKKGAMVTFVDDKGNATVVFRGTSGADEWADNVLGAYQTDTEQQKVAFNYINSLPYNNITVTGHSKGGNKAQYVTILSNKFTNGKKIDRCVAFDGQGFSPDFCKKYADEIKKYNNHITLIAPNDDYVNILMKQIAGNVIYTKPNRPIWEKLKDGDFTGIFQEHVQNRMIAFDKDGNPYLKEQTGREPLLTVLHEFIIYLEDNVSDEEREEISKWAADLARKLMSEDEKIRIEDLLSKESRNSAGAIIEVFLKFLGEVDPEIKRQAFKLFTRIKKNKQFTEADYEELQRIIELTAINVDSTYADDIENYSSSGADAGFTSSKGAFRDFRDEVKHQLTSLVDEVEHECFFDIGKWDVWYRVEKFFGHLNLSNYAGDVETYYRKVIDVNGTTVQNIETIFSNINDIDNKYKAKIEESIIDLVDMKSSILSLADSLRKTDVTVSVK